MVRRVALAGPDDFDGWRDAARALAAAAVPADRIVWDDGGGQGDLLASASPDDPLVGGAPFAVPRGFIDLARTAILHRDPERFALLYALLLRVRDHPGAMADVMADRADPLLHRVGQLAKAVRRDIHKMRAFVRFRILEDGQGMADGDRDRDRDRGRFVAWFEPDHHIVRANAGFFVRRFAAMRWSILTPDVSIHWDGETLNEGPGAARGDAPVEDPVEQIWKGYYAAIFNPARLKVGAMLSEMPKKYWRNLPEASLIPGLVAGAQAREAAMIAAPPAAPPQRPATVQTAWTALREEARGCTRCPLHRVGTRTVFGEGPLDAPLFFIGEQPGDREDLAGRPFVGPAGQMFDAALAEAGIERARIYVTNAVKHFKHEKRGKRRIHQTPETPEIKACRWWVEQEIALVRPRIIVALGATAARSLLGKAVTIGRARGVPIDLADGAQGWVTIHPSYLLRIPDEAKKAEERLRFVEELREIGRILDQPQPR